MQSMGGGLCQPGLVGPASPLQACSPDSFQHPLLKPFGRMVWKSPLWGRGTKAVTGGLFSVRRLASQRGRREYNPPDPRA